MNTYNKDVLTAGINYILEGESSSNDLRISQSLLLTYAKGDMATLKECLEQWEREGHLRIIKQPDLCQPDEPCVEMFRFIDQKSPIKGFLNWE